MKEGAFMSKFLWDLNIEDIPCGFEYIYQDALINYPYGKIVETISCDSSGTNISTCEYNPVKCRKIIITEFNDLRTKAIEIFNNKSSLDFKNCCNELLKIDMLLNSLLSEWTIDWFDNSSFQPKNFLIDHIKRFSFDCYFNDLDTPYDQFKFINLHK